MISILGIIVILALCYLLSKRRSHISLRTVLSGLVLQAALAFFILKTDSGRAIFTELSGAVTQLIELASRGGRFAFGELYDTGGFVFAFKVTAAIIFISSLVSVLYYLRILPPLLKALAFLLQRLMKVSGAEILANTASAFVGQVESALPLRPYLANLSQAQFFAIMTGGMSTMSAALLATYASLGIPADYLLAANLMGIPSGLVIAKIIWPSDPEESGQKLPDPETPEAANVIDAAVNGSQEGLKISLGVIAMVISFVSIVALLDNILGLFGLSLSEIFAFLLSPMARLLGASPEAADLIGSLIGTKIAINEFVAYSELAKKASICDFSERTILISTFALCGFANFGSVAIQLGAFSQILPERRSEFASMGILAMIAGALASCLSACWANLFFTL